MKRTLHVADGDPELCEIYEQFLTARGYDVETSTDGLECLEKIRQRQPAALVLDLELSWGGGDGVLAWLREEARTAWVPVVLTATTGSPQLISDLVVPPVVRCLQKPFTLTALLEAVRGAATQDLQAPRIRGCASTYPELFVG